MYCACVQKRVHTILTGYTNDTWTPYGHHHIAKGTHHGTPQPQMVSKAPNITRRIHGRAGCTAAPAPTMGAVSQGMTTDKVLELQPWMKVPGDQG